MTSLEFLHLGGVTIEKGFRTVRHGRNLWRLPSSSLFCRKIRHPCTIALLLFQLSNFHRVLYRFCYQLLLYTFRNTNICCNDCQLESGEEQVRIFLVNYKCCCKLSWRIYSHGVCNTSLAHCVLEVSCKHCQVSSLV